MRQQTLLDELNLVPFRIECHCAVMAGAALDGDMFTALHSTGRLMGFVFEGITGTRRRRHLQNRSPLLLYNVRCLMCHQFKIGGSFARTQEDVWAIRKRACAEIVHGRGCARIGMYPDRIQRHFKAGFKRGLNRGRKGITYTRITD